MVRAGNIPNPPAWLEQVVDFLLAVVDGGWGLLKEYGPKIALHTVALIVVSWRFMRRG